MTKDTISEIKKAWRTPADWMKAFTESQSATSGLTAYDLMPVVLGLYPVDTPLRNIIARVPANGGIQANWRAITGINTNSISLGVSEGNRGGVIATSTMDCSASYRALGLEDYVTFEADYAAMGFDDVKATAVRGLLNALFIGEEAVILGGNTSCPLGVTPTPTLSSNTSGGTLSAQTLSVICVALTLDGFMAGTVQGGIRGQVTRTNADGSSDTFGGGSAQKSANATITTTGSASSVSAMVSPVSGAVGYAWFWGTAGSEVLGAITTINSLVITAAAAGSQTAASLSASDNSSNRLVFDGLLSQVAKPGSNAYVYTMPNGTLGQGTPLTADGVGGIVEIDAALKHFWDTYRLSPSIIWVNSQEQTNITKKVLAGSSNGAQRFVINVNQGDVLGGDLVTSYLNKYSLSGPKAIPVMLHPNLPPGTILFHTEKLPYPLAGVANVLQIRTRRDYFQIEWPIKTRRYEYGVYMDGVLQNFFPPSFGVITNIGND